MTYVIDGMPVSDQLTGAFANAVDPLSSRRSSYLPVMFQPNTATKCQAWR